MTFGYYLVLIDHCIHQLGEVHTQSLNSAMAELSNALP